ncbi:hypothetical protein ACSBR2_026972 [Camellia fascicularis]
MNDAIAQVHPPTCGERPAAEVVDTLSLAVPPAPPPSHRQPRVREYVVSTPNPLEVQSRQQQQQQQHQQHCSRSVQRRRQDLEPLCRADENIPDTIRSLETPLGLGLHTSTSGKTVMMSVQRKQHAAVKLNKENGGRAG